MSPLALDVALVVSAYLIGSIPFGYLCGRVVRGIDIRQHGSGNIGATNVARVLGSKWGLVVLVLDLSKGLLPVAVVSPLLLDPAAPGYLHRQVAAGLATIAGHMFPCWLGFRGGKGVATALGVVICLGSWSTLVAVGVFALTVALCRLISLAAILGSIAFGISRVIQLWPSPFGEETWSLALFSVLVPLVIVVRHRENIARLVRGEEKPFRAAAASETTPAREGPDEQPGNS